MGKKLQNGFLSGKQTSLLVSYKQLELYQSHEENLREQPGYCTFWCIDQELILKCLKHLFKSVFFIQ